MPFPIDEIYIAQCEQRLGVTFPESFRNKMMEENGGTLETPPDAWRLYPFWDTSNRKRLARTANDIARETELARQWPGFSEDAIAFGTNDMGDQLVFIRNRENSSVLDPAVYWWDHETGRVHLIAEDFSQLP